MSILPAAHRIAPHARQPRDAPQRVAVVRAALALAWAAALFLTIGGHARSAQSDLPIAAALLLTTYPAIDTLASLVSASSADPGTSRLLRINAALSATAVAALAVTSLGSDAGSALFAFGAWAALSGALQLLTALRRRRRGNRQLPMIISGGLSTLAGVSFVASSSGHTVHLTNVSGYMALGALLFLLWAHRSRPAA
jgi:hypothetical protein